jgi:hypothetical protein
MPASLFSYGRKIYSDRIRHGGANGQLTDEDLKNVFNLYKMKYWGVVNSEQWQNNEQAVIQGGEIRAKYIAQSGKEIFLIRHPENYLFFVVQEDIDDNFLTDYFESLERERREYEQAMERINTSRNRRQMRPNGMIVEEASIPAPQSRVSNNGNYAYSASYTLNFATHTTRTEEG